MSDKTHIIMIHKTMLHRAVDDAMSLAIIAACVGIGWFLGSSALQWLGAIVAFVVLIGRSSKLYHRLTIEQAKAKIAEIEAELRQ